MPHAASAWCCVWAQPAQPYGAARGRAHLGARQRHIRPLARQHLRPDVHHAQARKGRHLRVQPYTTADKDKGCMVMDAAS